MYVIYYLFNETVAFYRRPPTPDPRLYQFVLKIKYAFVGNLTKSIRVMYDYITCTKVNQQTTLQPLEAFF